MPLSFGAKTERAFSAYGQLCVGVDPHASLLADWGLADSLSGLESFALSVLDAAAGTVGFLKPQVAFFERFGAAGFTVLEKLANRAAETDLVVIMDAKRGDIGSTMAAYFDAWLGRTAPFLCDALTVSPYLGLETFHEIQDECLERGKGFFALVATSNPEGELVQLANIDGRTLSSSIWRRLEAVNEVTLAAGTRLGSFGAVVGATLDLNRFGLSGIQDGCATPILAPGFGAQGAELGKTRRIFGKGADSVVHSVSRSVLEAGPMGLQASIVNAQRELINGLVAME